MCSLHHPCDDSSSGTSDGRLTVQSMEAASPIDTGIMMDRESRSSDRTTLSAQQPHDVSSVSSSSGRESSSAWSTVSTQQPNDQDTSSSQISDISFHNTSHQSIVSPFGDSSSRAASTSPDSEQIQGSRDNEMASYAQLSFVNEPSTSTSSEETSFDVPLDNQEEKGIHEGTSEKHSALNHPEEGKSRYK